jgi:hypothetical protein
VPGHRQLVGRCKNPDAHVGVGTLRREHECRLGEIHFLGNRLQRLGRQTARVKDHGELIAAEETVREDVEMQIPV